ncbi:amino acid permease [Ramlibacter sp. AW1]|uniref:Amino acid permease n=1 Tax=Ramlibacter aurantiacus TaxID=2801330 RepID=A0A936ZQX4_9BURK|nr:amino acid permease [Ramlibacter aurantiacus]MBL0421960.1 amino acid permease [Ramlibacter aurantiacus]
MSSSPAQPTAANRSPAAVLTLRHALVLIVGVVVGAGIFKVPSLVAQMTGSVGWMFTAWLLGGLVSLVGVLCYAELATAYPSVGGDYHFLHRAYGRRISFLFAWARFSVITTGSIALLAFVFGDYMHQVLPLHANGALGSALWATAVVVALWIVNSRGILAGASAQTWLTVVEVGGLLLVVAAALYWVAGGVPAAAGSAAPQPAMFGATPSLAGFGLAMVFVLLAYGGWNEAGYISAELKDNRRNMVRALVASILVITVLYVGVTWAYWRVLGLEGMGKSEAVAADVMNRVFGTGGQTLISVLVAIAALSSINATMIVGARTNYAVGCDWAALDRLARWDHGRSTPTTALAVQNVLALLLIGLGAWSGNGFRSMVEFTAPVFWLFFLLTGIALFILRGHEPAAPNPFRVPLYPLLPAIFCLTCAYMLWSSLSYVSTQTLGGVNAAWTGVVVLAVGVVLMWFIGTGQPGPAARGAISERRS